MTNYLPETPAELRAAALQGLLICDADDKSRFVLNLPENMPCDTAQQFACPEGIPGRPAKPELVAPGKVGRRAMHTVEGRAVLLHALAHIEMNAINLALDIIWRFADMPPAFYTDWMKVAREEAKHFSLLNAHLRDLGFPYGSFSAHNSLWEMAEKTKADLTARLALVPRTMEARGLDVTPGLMQKLVQAGDIRAGEIMQTIYDEEIGHVEIGNRWYNYQCRKEGHDALAYYPVLSERYKAPRLRGPFNLEGRRQAGFTESELVWLQGQ
ncbi:ferritin-like domain-containing protein [Undibacterium squillarum]|uniref:ferritin-like domain-containing protein n=1 Tax=Undibacterium squillarum TaxID=1131567 RepID=UPI0035B4D736